LVRINLIILAIRLFYNKVSCSKFLQDFNKIHTSSNPSEKGKIVKADRNTLHRIVTAFKAGREVNVSEILKHELMPVPIAIAETNGSLRSGNKSLLLDVLLKNVDTNGVIQKEGQVFFIFRQRKKTWQIRR
jgi:hypothetical protein